MRTCSLLLVPILAATASCLEPPLGAADPAKAKDDDPLAVVLISNSWSWEPTLTGKKEIQDIQFYKGGIAENRQFFSCSWEIIAPRTVQLQNTNNTGDNGKIAYLVFDAEFKHFVGIDFNGRSILEGYRREPVDSKRPIPPPREPLGKRFKLEPAPK